MFSAIRPPHSSKLIDESAVGEGSTPAPDGIAIIGADPRSEGNYLQHYFDARGVARVYKMSFEDSVWKLWRDEPGFSPPDFSPLDFSQRFIGAVLTGQLSNPPGPLADLLSSLSLADEKPKEETVELLTIVSTVTTT